MSDDAAGVRVIEALRRREFSCDGVELLDGGTLGLDLLPRLEGVERLLIVDAVEAKQPPGSVLRLEGEEITAVFRTMLSPHQMGLQDLLAVASLTGCLPNEIILWGVQPSSIEMGMELSPAVAPRIGFLADRVLEELAVWGLSPAVSSV